MTLEEVKISNKAITKFKLPFKLIYGQIKKLKIKLPWKEGFNVPTEIEIDSIDILLNAIIDYNDWEYINFNEYQTKLDYLIKFSNEKIIQLSQIIINDKNEKNNLNDNNLFIKIFDNLHIIIKNIHLSIQELDNYLLGINIKEFSISNTNKEWKESFIDRNITKIENIYKLLKITDLELYLNTDIQNIKEQIQENLQISERISKICELSQNDFIISSISFEIKLNQKNDDDIESWKSIGIPRTYLLLQLDKFDLKIKKQQYDCIMSLINLINNYQNALSNFNKNKLFKFFRPEINIHDAINLYKIKKNNLPLHQWWIHSIKMIIMKIKNNSEFTIPYEYYKKYYEIYFKKYLEMKNQKINEEKKKLLSEKELNKLYKILEVADLDILCLWSKNLILEKCKEKLQLSENEKEKYNNNGDNNKIFSEKEDKKMSEILNIEITKLQKLIKGDENELNMKVDLRIDTGSIKFNNYFIEYGINEGFDLKFGGLQFLDKKWLNSNELSCEISKYNINLINEINNDVTTIPIVYKNFEEIGLINKKNKININNEIKNDSFIIKLFWKQVTKIKEIQSEFKIILNSFYITYHQIFMERIFHFFKFKIKTQLQLDNFESHKQLKNLIKLEIKPIKIIVPINKYDIKNSKLIIFNFGSILNIKENSFILFNGEVNYYPNLDDLLYNFGKNKFTILQNFNASFNLINTGLLTKLKININSLTFNLNSEIYTILQIFDDVIKTIKESELYSQVNLYSQEIKSNAILNTIIYKKSLNDQNYEKFNAFLSSGYIYFYYNENLNEELAGYFHLKNCKFIDENDLNFKLISEYGIIYLKASDQQTFILWKEAVIKRVEEIKLLSKYKENYNNNELLSDLKQKNPNDIYFTLELNTKEMFINLYDDKEKFINGVVHNLNFSLNRRIFDTEIKISFNSIIILDDLNTEYKTILSTKINNF